LILGLLLPFASLRADDDLSDLPPPPESGETGLTPIDEAGDTSAGAELPPPPVPGAPEAPTSTANAAEEPPPVEDTAPPADAAQVEAPAGEALPPLPSDSDTAANDLGDTDEGASPEASDQDTDEAANSEVPSDEGLIDVPGTTPPMAEASEFSSANELKNVAMSDRIKSKDLDLWLSLGPSYATLTGKGSYGGVSTVSGSNDPVGGLGYNAGIGFMLDSTFQFEFDFTGTPKTKNTTVDHAMFGFGPRLGFLTLMGVFGVQQGPDPTADAGAVARIFAIGARAGLDLILKHGDNSRTSVGLAPEVYYITPQGADGYKSMGVSVSLRIYGYENAF
jgi:hypothetical protein